MANRKTKYFSITDKTLSFIFSIQNKEKIKDVLFAAAQYYFNPDAKIDNESDDFSIACFKQCKNDIDESEERFAKQCEKQRERANSRWHKDEK